MEKKNNMALASMIVGIVSIVMCCCCFLGAGLGSLAVILAMLSKTSDTFENNAKIGLITGIIGLVLGMISVVVWIMVIANFS